MAVPGCSKADTVLKARCCCNTHYRYHLLVVHLAAAGACAGHKFRSMLVAKIWYEQHTVYSHLAAAMHADNCIIPAAQLTEVRPAEVREKPEAS